MVSSVLKRLHNQTKQPHSRNAYLSTPVEGREMPPEAEDNKGGTRGRKGERKMVSRALKRLRNQSKQLQRRKLTCLRHVQGRRDVLQPSISGRRKPKPTSEAKGGTRRRKGERKMVSSARKRLVNHRPVERLPVYAVSKAGAMSSSRRSRPKQQPNSGGRH